MSSEIQTAEVTDRHSKYMLIGIFFFSMKFAVSAGMSVTEGTLNRYLDYLEIALAIAGVAFIVPICVWKLIRLRGLPTSKRILYFAPDSFTVDAIKRSQQFSWKIVFFLLIMLEIVSRETQQFPTVFYIQITISVMLGMFAASFLYISRDTDETENEIDHDA
tara:strand:+ start:12471 stop:12956 length:486 start_codon:yes stop_codon:yes gene_type:complete